MSRFLCSAVIPAYNCESLIDVCLASVQAQTVADIEIIVVDDCSLDSTAQAVAQRAAIDGRIRYFRQAENTGVAAVRNRGVQEARSEWIAFLDSDDLWFPQKLEKQLALAQACKGDLIYTGAQCMDTHGNMLGRFVSVPPCVDYEMLLRGNDIICSSVLVRRELLLQCPMEHSHLHEDYIAWLKILREAGKAFGVTEPLVGYRFTEGSKSRNKLKSARMTWESYKYAGVPFVKRSFCFVAYALHGIKRYYG